MSWRRRLLDMRQKILATVSNSAPLVRRVSSGTAGVPSKGRTDMSFQAYLDTIEDKTGKTPRELLALAAERGFDGPAVKAGAVIEWLKVDYGLGRGHAMALLHVIKNGPKLSTLDGKATRPT
jgi:Domain of unknown function (DUF4287)